MRMEDSGQQYCRMIINRLATMSRFVRSRTRDR